MVAVRSAHLNKAGEFDPQKWIASLGISSQQSCERLTETWAYCLRTTQGHPDADLLLWRGVEMVEILFHAEYGHRNAAGRAAVPAGRCGRGQRRGAARRPSGNPSSR